MDQGDKPKFLLLFAVPPAQCCCVCFSLKTAVYIFGVLDIIVSIGQMLGALSTIGSENYEFPDTDIAICALPFAVLGMRGISRLNSEWLNLYSVFKQVEGVTLLVNAFLFALVMCTENCIAGFGGFAFSIPFILYSSYVIWSAEALLLTDKGTIAQGGSQVSELSESRGPFPPVYMPPGPSSV